MKKFLAVLMACVIVFSIAKAQVRVGVKAGAASTSLQLSQNNKSKFGMYAGVAAGIKLQKGFSLQTELYYSQQGNKYYRLHYINLPVLVQYDLPKGFYVETGIQGGLLTRSKYKGPGGAEVVKITFKPADISIPFGLGFKMKKGLGVNLRYNRGLTNVNKNYMTSRNSVVQLGLFYNFKEYRLDH